MDLLEKFENTDEKIDLTKSEDIVFSMLNSMDGRRGLSGFDQVDRDIQLEILEELVELVNEKLDHE